jgi:nitrogen regulatory protein P-II 1
MKHLTLIIHTDIQQEVTEQLRDLELISGFTFTLVEGHGVEPEKDAFLSARDQVVGHIPRLRVDILLEDDKVDLVLNTLRNEITGIKNNGIYWLTNVLDNDRL